MILIIGLSSIIQFHHHDAEGHSYSVIAEALMSGFCDVHDDDDDCTDEHRHDCAGKCGDCSMNLVYLDAGNYDVQAAVISDCHADVSRAEVVTGIIINTYNNNDYTPPIFFRSGRRGPPLFA